MCGWTAVFYLLDASCLRKLAASAFVRSPLADRQRVCAALDREVAEEREMVERVLAGLDPVARHAVIARPGTLARMRLQ